jgi:hypothetical protein
MAIDLPNPLKPVSALTFDSGNHYRNHPADASHQRDIKRWSAEGVAGMPHCLRSLWITLQRLAKFPSFWADRSAGE